MKKIWTPSLLENLPDSVLNDSKLRASAEALDIEIRRTMTAVREVLHIPRLDELNGRILDYLAEGLHVDNYEPIPLSDDEKKQLIRESIAWHRIKGTRGAVEKISTLAMREPKVTEWFEYGGKPYHFKVTAKEYIGAAGGERAAMRMVNSAKNVRSWIDDITIDYTDLIDAIQLFLGFVHQLQGSRVYGVHRPRDGINNLFVGGVVTRSGAGLTYNLSQPLKNRLMNYHIGQILIRSGEVTVKAEPVTIIPNILKARETAIADILIADVGIARPSGIDGDVIPPDNPNPIEPDNPEDVINELKRPRLIRLRVGQVLVRSGSITINPSANPIEPDNPEDVINELKRPRLIRLRVGQVLARSGSITINPSANPIPAPWKTQETAIADGLVADVGIARPSGVEDNAIPIEDADFIEGDWLRLYQNFPTGRDKPILLANPRSDLVVGDIQSFSDLTSDSKIFLNSKAEGTLGIDRVDLIRGFNLAQADDDVTLPGSDTMRLFFDFPNGNKRKVMLKSLRNGITAGELKKIGDVAAENKVLLNCRNEATQGMTHVALIKNWRIRGMSSGIPIKWSDDDET